ncbi:hypothetical protein HPB48_021189 [Haemaphysalis longicornis]|uniref:Uncharacterized protein n=1 Tax=Haemaphysalis longicornis TaxID=44386 RepID=A0A9J6GJP5_HAELO|nr:hypothetical protein HPB48_021189 [Haemaphysalis longicornis]
MSSLSDETKLVFLDALITFLDVREFYKHDNGTLTKLTHTSWRHSAYALLEFTKSCLAELAYNYVLLGKVQMDGLEHRFSQYRQIAGGHSHIYIRQIYECEGRLRLSTPCRL